MKKQELFWWAKKKKVKSRAKYLKLQMNKRKRFVVVVLVLGGGLMLLQYLSVELRVKAIMLLGLLSAILSAWALRLELSGWTWLVDLILPVMYSTSVALFYFLLPQQMLTRGIMLVVFLISMYALLLTANIFAVATNRTIQLLRSAKTVGFLLSIMTMTLLYHVIFSFNWLIIWVVLAVWIVSFLIFLEGVWSYTLSLNLENKELLYSLVGSSVVAEMALAIGFWQVESLMASVMLSMVSYVLLGLFQQEIDKRLFQKTIQEYIWFALIMYLVVMVVVLSRWLA